VTKPPFDLAAEPLDGLADVPARDWDRLVPDGGGGLKHAYLTAWEHVDLDGLRSRPVVARRRHGGPLAAAIPGYFYDLDVTRMIDARAEVAARLLRRAWRRFAIARIYEVGCPTALGGPLLHDRALHPAAAASALLPEAVAEAERGGADLVVVEDFAGRRGQAGGVLTALGFEALPIMPTVWLDVPFRDFDGYLAAMRAQYRRRARKVFERSARLRPRHRSDFSELAPELARLSKDMFDRAREVKREVLGERFFRVAATRAELSLLSLDRPDGSLSAFALLFDDRPCLHFLACGFEQEEGQREAAYFRLLYEIVRAAIAGGFRHVDFGVTTLAPKLDTGGVPVPLVAWMRHRNRAVQRVLATAARRVVRPVATEPRKVFKTPAPPRLPAPVPAVPARVEAA
jgi:predicted N-acyltransferase